MSRSPNVGAQFFPQSPSQYNIETFLTFSKCGLGAPGRTAQKIYWKDFENVLVFQVRKLKYAKKQNDTISLN